MMKSSTLSSTEQRLKEAITSCRIYQTRQLLENGTAAEFVDEEGYSPLLRAVRLSDDKHRTRSSLLKLLLQYGADVNTTDPQGRHALTYACMAEKEDVVLLLLDTSIHNIDLNLKDFGGNTPLMHAVIVGNIDIVRILVDALNRFQINMDIRNLEDRTPYLEAKRLGMEECARILLEEGHASKNIQVNPYLDFMISNDKCHGEVRSLGLVRDGNSSKERCCSQGNHMVTRHQHTLGKAIRARHDVQDTKRLLKRKATAPKSLRRRNQEERDSNFSQRTKSRSIRNKSGTENVKIGELGRQVPQEIQEVQEIQVEHEEGVEPELERLVITPTPRPLSASRIATDEQRAETATLIPVCKQPARLARPSTAAPSMRCEPIRSYYKENKSPELTGRTFLTAGNFRAPGRIALNADSTRSTRLRHYRAKTAPVKTFEDRRRSVANFHAESISSAEEISWYSHFSINTSPSVAFIHKIMSLYAEQLSPESSYRPGVKLKPVGEDPTSPTVASESEPDKQSDGRGSSSCSIRSKNRKFSAVTRTIASYLSSKKALAMIKAKERN